MVDALFGTLFSVELLHKYFASQLCNDFTITASEKTSGVLSGYHMVAKQYENMLYAGIQSQKQTGAGGIKLQPLIKPSEGAQFTFFLQLNHNLFFNYTNLPATRPPNKIYYFCNRNNNTGNGKNFLSQPLTYINTQTYSPGDLAADSTGKIFESILSGTGNAPSTANSQFWMVIDNNQYSSEADLLQWMPMISVFTFSTAQSAVTVTLWGYDATAKTYTRQVYTKTQNFSSAVLSYNLDLSSLSPGKYKMTINGITQWIYLNDELALKKVFAVLEIFNDSSLPAAYQLLDGSGNLLSPLYSIYFLNRYSIWKFVVNSGNASLITDTASVYSFTTPAASTIYSKTPVPLTEKPLSLKIQVGTNTPTGPIACPSPERLVTYQPNPPSGDIYNCSEIYLNY